MRNRESGHPLPRNPHRAARLRRRFATLVTIAALLAGGCASSPAVSYYQLRALEPGSATPLEGAPVVAVGPVTLPEYLARTQMVTPGAGTRITVDDFNRWAEPLEKAVPRILVLNLTALAPEAVVVRYIDRAAKPSQRLFATISRLDVDDQGSARLVVQWGVNSAEGTPLQLPRTSRYEGRAVPADSPEAVAAALSRLLEDFSRDAAAALQQLIDLAGQPGETGGAPGRHSAAR